MTAPMKTKLISVQGLGELQANCAALGVAMKGPAGQKAADAMAFKVQTFAKLNIDKWNATEQVYDSKRKVMRGVLIDTAAMKGGIAARPSKHPSGNPVSEVAPSVRYAIYHEMGTCKMPARPFLVPAVEEHVPELVAAADLILGQIIAGMLPA